MNKHLSKEGVLAGDATACSREKAASGLAARNGTGKAGG
jgi:hypothetical protein